MREYGYRVRIAGDDRTWFLPLQFDDLRPIETQEYIKETMVSATEVTPAYVDDMPEFLCERVANQMGFAHERTEGNWVIVSFGPKFKIIDLTEAEVRRFEEEHDRKDDALLDIVNDVWHGQLDADFDD